MLKEKKYIIIAIGLIILVGVLIGLYFRQKYSPANMIERKLNFKLPSSAKIINYKYYGEDEYFKVKISFDIQDLGYVRTKLVEYFKQELIIKSDEELPCFGNYPEWRGLYKEDIISSYKIMVSGKIVKTHVVWAFITNEKDGQCYLYISY